MHDPRSIEPDGIIRDEIRALTAYHVPLSRGMVKLDAMENPYPLPDVLRRDIAQIVSTAALNRYPDPDPANLKALLREVMKIPQEMAITLGNGSDEIIQMVSLAVAKAGATVLSVEPGFTMFKMIATFAGLNYVGVPLCTDFSLDPGALLEAMTKHKAQLIFLAYPNNPTGNLFDAKSLQTIIEAAPGLVVVDEAYFAFADATTLPWLTRYANLLVMRTVSKLGMAGIRLGFLAGHSRWLKEFEKVRLPYNVNIMTQLVAQHLLRHMDVLLTQATAIKAGRADLQRSLGATPGVTVFPSDANFILFRVDGADRVFDALKQRGILIKNLNRTHPFLDDCLRVTVGTREENERFIRALHESLESA